MKIKHKRFPWGTQLTFMPFESVTPPDKKQLMIHAQVHHNTNLDRNPPIFYQFALPRSNYKMRRSDLVILTAAMRSIMACAERFAKRKRKHNA